MHGIAGARDKLRRKAGEGRRRNSSSGLEGQQAAPSHWLAHRVIEEEERCRPEVVNTRVRRARPLTVSLLGCLLSPDNYNDSKKEGLGWPSTPGWGVRLHPAGNKSLPTPQQHNATGFIF